MNIDSISSATSSIALALLYISILPSLKLKSIINSRYKKAAFHIVFLSIIISTAALIFYPYSHFFITTFRSSLSLLLVFAALIHPHLINKKS